MCGGRASATLQSARACVVFDLLPAESGVSGAFLLEERKQTSLHLSDSTSRQTRAIFGSFAAWLATFSSLGSTCLDVSVVLGLALLDFPFACFESANSATCTLSDASFAAFLSTNDGPHYIFGAASGGVSAVSDGKDMTDSVCLVFADSHADAGGQVLLGDDAHASFGCSSLSLARLTR